MLTHEAFIKAHEKRVVVDVIAPVLSCKDSIITVQVSQYIPFATAASDKKGSITVAAHIPDTGRYKTNKPAPLEKTVVHMHGYLSGMDVKPSVSTLRLHLPNSIDFLFFDRKTLILCILK